MDPGRELLGAEPAGDGRGWLLVWIAVGALLRRLATMGTATLLLATDDLMSQLSLGFQDVYLFEGTILDNIRVGRPGATDEQVHQAAHLARADEIVDRLQGGWHTQVGEGGARLSGGERQRVSIARALLKDADRAAR